MLANLSGSPITIGRADDRKLLARSASARCLAAYLYSAAGEGESSTDLAWDGQASIHELGRRLALTDRFPTTSQMAVADIDVERLRLERMRTPTFNDAAVAAGHPELAPQFLSIAARTPYTFYGLVGPKGLPQPIVDRSSRALNEASASAEIGTQPVEAAYVVVCSGDLIADIRSQLTGFIHISEYGNRKPIHAKELGSWENFRFVASPHCTAYLNAGTTTTANTRLANPTARAMWLRWIGSSGASRGMVQPTDAQQRIRVKTGIIAGSSGRVSA